MDYLSSKNEVAASSVLTTARNNHHGLEPVVPKYKSLHPNDRSLSHSSFGQGMNETTHTPKQMKVSGSQVMASATMGYMVPIWLKSSGVEFQTWREALHSLGPLITTSKSFRVKDIYVSEYKRLVKTCPAQMRLQSQEAGWFALTLLEIMHLHNHEANMQLGDHNSKKCIPTWPILGSSDRFLPIRSRQ
jgi:hypothetical protein